MYDFTNFLSRFLSFTIYSSQLTSDSPRVQVLISRKIYRRDSSLVSIYVSPSESTEIICQDDTVSGRRRFREPAIQIHSTSLKHSEISRKVSPLSLLTSAFRERVAARARADTWLRLRLHTFHHRCTSEGQQNAFVLVVRANLILSLRIAARDLYKNIFVLFVSSSLDGAVSSTSRRWHVRPKMSRIILFYEFLSLSFASSFLGIRVFPLYSRRSYIEFGWKLKFAMYNPAFPHTLFVS